MLKAWMRERHGRRDDPLFVTIRDGKLSRDAATATAWFYSCGFFPDNETSRLRGST
jgi:hypothetical protein